MIRKAKPNELSQVMQIWLEGNIESHPFIPTDYWRKNSENVRKVLATAEIYVYEDETEKKVIGFLGLSNNHIGGLLVHSSHRSFGIGEDLIKYVKLYQPYLITKVYKKNIKAVEFYQSEGFHITKEQINPSTEEWEYEMIWEKQ